MKACGAETVGALRRWPGGCGSAVAPMAIAPEEQ